MKTRSGFVSNSSSSSFVVMGARISEEELRDMGWYDEDNDYTNNVPEEIDIYYDEHKEGYIVGIPLCETEGRGLDNRDLTENELKEIMYQAAHKLNRPIKLMMGTRPT